MVNKIRLGVQLFTFRKYLKNENDIAKVFNFVKKIGGESVQLSRVGNVPAKVIADIAKSEGLVIAATHSPFLRMRDDLDSLIEEHYIYGCSDMGLTTIPSKFFDKKSKKGILEFTDFMNKTSEKLKNTGIRLHYHNHAFEFKEIDGEQIYDILIENMLSDIGFSFDAFWAKVGKKDPLEIIDKLQSRLFLIHMKDYRKFLFLFKMLPPGFGDIDYLSLLEYAKKYSPKDALIELDIARKPFEAVEKGMRYLKS